MHLKFFNSDFTRLLILVFVAFLINLKSVNYFLFQDDFFNFNITRIDNFTDYLKFYYFRDDIIAYRPISLLSYSYLLYRYFDFNAMAFRLITFGIFFACSLMLFRLISIITLNRKIALLTTAIWSLSSIHFMSLSQFNYNMIGTLFYLIASIFFIKFLNKNDKRYFVASLLSFLLSVGSFEFAITWPLIFSSYCILVLKIKLKRVFTIFSPYILISAVYLILRSIYVKPAPTVEYEIALNTNSLKALLWYLLWSFNIPEEFKKQIASKIIFFNENFLWQYWVLIFKSFTLAIWTIFLGICIPFYFIVSHKISISLRFISFCSIWFFVGISPVLLLPNHNFIMYLTFPVIGIYLLISYLIVKSNIHFLTIPLLVIWVYSSTTTLDFYHKNSYIVEAQKFSRSFYTKLQPYRQISNYSAFYYPLDDIEKRQPLMDQEGIKAVLKNSTISIYYNREDLVDDYKNGQIRGFIYLYPQ